MDVRLLLGKLPMIHVLFSHGSYLLIIMVLVVTGVGVPIPEEVSVVTAGVMASNGQLDPWLAFMACLVGALVGDCVMYWMGYHFGRSVIREHRWWARLVTPEREVQMEEMVLRHGLKAMFLARFLVGLRSPVYLAAGILRLPFRRFFLFDLFCASAVIGTFFTLSYSYGQTITQWVRRAEILGTLAVVVALVVGGGCWWRRHQRGALRASPPPGFAELPPLSEPEPTFEDETAAEAEPVEHTV